MDLLKDLEYFLRDQRLKLNADKERLEKSTSPTFPATPVRNEDSDILQSGRRPKLQTTPCQTDISIPLNVIESPISADMADHPKYGLPGLGEFNDRHQMLLKEQKKELNNILSQAIKAKYERTSRSAPVDYDELLARKRDEELKYRYINQFESPNLHGTYSEEFLDQNYLSRNGLAFQRIRPPEETSNFVKSEVEDLTDLLSRLQRYTALDRYESLPRVIQPNLYSVSNLSPTTNYEKPIPNRSPHVNPIITPDREKPKYLPPNPDVGVVPRERERRIHEEKQRAETYRKELEEQMREQRERRKRILADEKEDIISNAVPPYLSGRNQNGSNISYQSDLLKQIEETRLRKQLEKENQIKWEQKFDAENSSSPWKPSPSVPHSVDLLVSPKDSVHGPDGVRNIPDKWHDGRWPLPENKPVDRPKLNYQEELRLQIEEKKRREKAEKENQRREEEKLAERLEEQRRKIQAEFEAEQKRQQLKEEDARRKAALAIEKQDKERVEAERKKKLSEGREWWEKENEAVVNRKSPKSSVVIRSPSPPLPTLQKVSGRIHTPPFIPTPKQSPRNRQIGTPRLRNIEKVEKSRTIDKGVRGDSPRKKSSLPSIRINPDPKEWDRHASNDESPRDGVLSQLSAMRRKLQTEQRRIQKQMEKNEDYEVYDNRLEQQQRVDEISTGRRRDYSNSFDVKEIANKNRERQAKLNKWQTSELE